MIDVGKQTSSTGHNGAFLPEIGSCIRIGCSNAVDPDSSSFCTQHLQQLRS